MYDGDDEALGGLLVLLFMLALLAALAASHGCADLGELGGIQLPSKCRSVLMQYKIGRRAADAMPGPAVTEARYEIEVALAKLVEENRACFD